MSLWYFKPLGDAVAQYFAAQPCNPPDRHNLELLTGSRLCWPALFQD